MPNSMADVLIVIPARMAATRLPGKPLADIAGIPMIVHVLRRVEAAALGPVVVATDSPEIEAVVHKAGGHAVMTRADHGSGSDRVFEALGKVDSGGSAAIVVNVQGDLPTLEPSDITAAVALLADPAVDIGTSAAEITRRGGARQRRGSQGRGQSDCTETVRALYFTRATAPYGEGPLYHHIGLYAFRRTALDRFVGLPPSPLEKREKLEQLRALEAGMRIDVAIVDTAPLGVDTPEDLARARAMLSIGHDDARKSHSRASPARIRTSPAKRLIASYEPLPCPTFEDAFAAVRTGRANLAMIPIDNSVAVTRRRHSSPHAAIRAHIVGEWFLPVQHQLMAPKGATLKTIKTVESHIHALGQCRNIIRALRIKAIVAADTAGAAREVAEAKDVTRAALATSSLENYGLGS